MNFATQGGLQQQGGQSQFPNAQQAAAPDTLLRALSQMEALNKRLGGLSDHIAQIAVSIGGPWPADKAGQTGGAPAATSPPAMTLLNSHVDTAHLQVASIEEAVAAIRRSLGS